MTAVSRSVDSLHIGPITHGTPGTQKFVDSTDPLPTTQSTGLSGERMSDSATRSKIATIDECFCTVVSATTAQTIGGGVANDTYLLGITVVAALTGTCVITGFQDGAGAAQSITFPATTVAGFKDFKGAMNAAGALTVTCSNAADDNLVLVHWAHAVAA